MAETARLFGRQAEQNGCALSLDTGGVERLLVMGDPIRIRQVLGNFVSNAVKFTRNGVIVIRFRRQQAGEALRLRFEVEDTGVGLSADDISRLFKPFEQAEAGTTRKFGGTGLGLAISKRLVRMMDGDIGASGRPGEGALFWFTCLVHPGNEAELPAEQVARPAARPLRVLVAEDNAINAMIVKLGLEQRSHQVTLVEDGRHAVEAAASGRHDIVLMDMQMPVMDGIEATRRIRALTAPLCNVPIVALTADAVSEHRAAYMQAGLTDFLTKPLDWHEVDAALGRHGPVRMAAPPCDPREKRAPDVINRGRLLQTRDMVPPRVFAELLAELAAHAGESLTRMRRAIGSRDSSDIRSIAHNLKGLCLQFGADQAAGIAYEIEAAASPECATAKLPALEQAVHDLTVEIEHDWCDESIAATAPAEQPGNVP